MGCDIHLFVEIKKEGKWTKFEEDYFTLDEFDKKYYKKDKGTTPFDWRSYGMFGFLANVRNYSHSEFLQEYRGLPIDCDLTSEEKEDIIDSNYHSHGYLLLSELLAFDYNKNFWDRRVTKQVSPNGWNGAALAEEGEGTHPTYKEFLGNFFFTHLEELKQLGNPEDVRIVFYFDN